MEREKIIELLKDELMGFDTSDFCFDEDGFAELCESSDLEGDLYAEYVVKGCLIKYTYDAGDYYTPPSDSGEIEVTFEDIRVWNVETDELIFEADELPELTYTVDW